MTTLVTPYPAVPRVLPTSGEWRAMFTRPAVLITAIICMTVVVLSALGGTVYLAANGHGTEAILSLVGALNLGGIVAIWQKVRSVEANTNGTMTKLTDAAIKSPPVEL